MRTMLSPPKPGDSHSAIPSTELGGIVSGLRLGLGGGANLSAPTGATKEERSIWDQTHSAFTSNPEAMAILTQNLDMLYQVFQVFCESIEGVAVVKLTNSRNGGLYRLLELYDVLPTCVSKMEAKVLFSLILNAQVYDQCSNIPI